jgi:hypothetical protein
MMGARSGTNIGAESNQVLASAPQHATLRPEETSELAICFYNAARAEILQRLNMREATFLGWATTAALLFTWLGGIKKASLRIDLLELMPFLALAFGLALYRHSFIIRKFGEHIRNDLNPHLGQKDPAVPPHWDYSPILRGTFGRIYLRLEFLTFGIFIVALRLLCVGDLLFYEGRPWYARRVLFVEAIMVLLLCASVVELWQPWQGTDPPELEAALCLTPL